MTLREAITEASQHIARRDAETLLLHLLHRERAWLLAHDDEPIADAAAFRSLVARRATNEPLQHITGKQEFYGLPFRITADTLIPRPETEHLVEAVILWSTQFHDGRKLRIADVGTGSGAIAIALATHVAGVEILAIDQSQAALSIAEANAVANGCTERITFLHNDLLSTLDPRQPFDAIVSNPPYVPSTDAATMQPDVVRFEPHTALFAGPDGLDIYRRLIPQAHALLKPKGLLAMEFGFGQRESLERLFTDEWQPRTYIPDLQGIDRVVTALRSR